MAIDWQDKAGALAIECEILREMIDDDIEEYPTIKFNTRRHTSADNIDGRWMMVYGKQVEIEGLSFGIYHDGREWHVVELMSGRGVLSTPFGFQAAIVMAEIRVQRVGEQGMRETVEQALAETGAPPWEPIEIDMMVPLGIEFERSERDEGIPSKQL